MGQVSVIAALAALFIGGLTLYYIQGSTNAAESRLGEHQYQQLARDAAVAGLQLTIRKLAADGNPGSWDDVADRYDWASTAYGNGSFKVVSTPCTPTGADPCAGAADPEGDVIDVDVVGYSGSTRLDAAGNKIPIRHLILARFERRYDDGGIPPQFRYGIIADNILKFQGNAGVFSTDPNRNVNVHSNGTITNNGGAFLVEGYGTYSADDGDGLKGKGDTRFRPREGNDFNGDSSNVFQADPIPIIDLDEAALREQAAQCGAIINPMALYPEGDPRNGSFTLDGDDIASNLNLTASSIWPWASAYEEGAIQFNSNTVDGIPCGGQDPDPDASDPYSGNPFVFFIDGDATFVNTIRVTGYGNIVTKGNMTIKPEGHGGGMYGDLIDTNGSDPGGIQTTLLIGSLQDMNIGLGGGNACLGLGPATYSYTDAEGDYHSRNNLHCQSGSGDFEAGATVQVEGILTMSGTPYFIGGLVANEGNIDDQGNPQVFHASPNESIVDPGFNFEIPIGPILIAYSEWQCGLIDAAGNDAYNCTL